MDNGRRRLGFDIGYGGLDHVLSPVKTSMSWYSTRSIFQYGGQASRLPDRKVAQFAASGKSMKKKSSRRWL
jgi:hypothetical protein